MPRQEESLSELLPKSGQLRSGLKKKAPTNRNDNTTRISPAIRFSLDQEEDRDEGNTGGSVTMSPSGRTSFTRSMKKTNSVFAVSARGAGQLVGKGVGAAGKNTAKGAVSAGKFVGKGVGVAGKGTVKVSTRRSEGETAVG